MLCRILETAGFALETHGQALHDSAINLTDYNRSIVPKKRESYWEEIGFYLPWVKCRRTATYARGCKDRWRRGAEERRVGKGEVERRVQLRGKTMNVVGRTRDGSADAFLGKWTTVGGVVYSEDVDSIPVDSDRHDQTFTRCCRHGNRTTSGSPAVSRPDCLCGVSGHFLLGIIRARRFYFCSDSSQMFGFIRAADCGVLSAYCRNVAAAAAATALCHRLRHFGAGFRNGQAGPLRPLHLYRLH